MKVELWYDAVAQETDILINGVPVEKNDVYGFLYPVRNYPIQSWLYPNGSWRGIEYQIKDLARGENVELTFHGRKCDYDDLCKCLSENNMIELRFVKWDICDRYDELISNFLSTLKSIDSIMQGLLSILKLNVIYSRDFNISVAESDWAYHIYNESDLAKADELSHKCCCYVHDGYFKSYEKLHELLYLTRTLRMPADAIYCCFKNRQTKEEYMYYAQSFQRMNFRFCLEDTDYKRDAERKYGIPSIVKLKIEKCGGLSKTICDSYMSLKESTQKEFNGLKKNIVTLNQQEKERCENIKNLRDNADKFRIGVEQIYQYIEILLSASKNNKGEIFHYECIDKFNETINLYLNANLFTGVK